MAGTEVLKHELTEMDIDEDLFWKMQPEEARASDDGSIDDSIEEDDLELPF